MARIIRVEIDRSDKMTVFVNGKIDYILRFVPDETENAAVGFLPLYVR